MPKHIKNIQLLLNLVATLALISSGLVLMTYATGDATAETAGMSKEQWLRLHQVVASVLVLFILLHLYERRSRWMQYFKTKKDSSHATKQIKRNSLALMLITLLSVLSGFAAWFAPDGCTVCSGIHDKSGLVFIVLTGFHLIRNTYLRPAYFHFRKYK